MYGYILIFILLMLCYCKIYGIQSISESPVVSSFNTVLSGFNTVLSNFVY